jgi:predicted transcriptional regulator
VKVPVPDFYGDPRFTTPVTSGADLRSERIRAGVRAFDVADVMDRSPAFITKVEGRDEVDETTVRRYRRAIQAIVKQRLAARRELIKELVAAR